MEGKGRGTEGGYVPDPDFKKSPGDTPDVLSAHSGVGEAKSRVQLPLQDRLLLLYSLPLTFSKS